MARMGIVSGEYSPVSDSTVPQLLEELLEGNMKIRYKPAIVSSTGVTTFQEMYDTSCVISGNINQHLVTYSASGSVAESSNSPQERVIAILLPPGIKRMCALFGVWKSQCAYVPLDQNLPEQRIKYIINECKPAYIITTMEDLSETVTAVCAEANVPVLLYDGLLKQDNGSNSSLPNKIHADPLLAVLYTSGSSGKPKGVKIRTANLLNRLLWQWDVMPPQETDVGCHKTSLLFVDSLTEVLSCLLKGVSIVIPPSGSHFNIELLLQTIKRYRVTNLVLVPTLLKMIIAYISTDSMDAINVLGNVTNIISSGEILPPDLASRCIDILPKGSTLWNFYGSTETCGDATYNKYHNLNEIRAKTVDGCLSIGKPIYNTTIFILDESDNIVPEGETGEICVLGDPVADGYIGGESTDSFKIWNREDGSTSILYLTGDMGMMTHKGLIYLGRKDTLIKVRGQRINLKEVDTVLTATNLVKQSVTQNILNEFNDVHNVVCFYTNLEDDISDIDKESLEERLKQHIACMLPSFLSVKLCLVDVVPMMASGKTDIQALKGIWRQKCEEVQATVKQQNSSYILDIISNNLEVSQGKIDLDSRLTEIGTNSFSMTMIGVDLIKAGYQVQFGDVLSCKTIGELLELAKSSKDIDQDNDASTNASNKTVLIEDTEYNIHLIASIEKEKQDSLIKMMAKSFIDKNPLDLMAGTTLGEFEDFLKSFWSEILSDNLSFCIEDSKGKIIAATLAMDVQTNIDPRHAYEHVLQINDDVERPVRDALMTSGERWVDSLLTAADVTLNDDVALALIVEMDREMIKVVKERGYHGIVTVNSHPVTMVISETCFGFETRNILHVKSWDYKGEKPFSEAKDDYYLKAMIKKF